MNAPYPLAGPCASMALFAVDAARSGLAGRTGRAAADRHVARAEQADVGLAGRIRLDIARAGDRDVERLRDEPVGVDIARAGHVELARFRGAAPHVQVAPPRPGPFHPPRRQLAKDRTSAGWGER